MMKRAVIIAFALVMLSACGYRGALVLPQDTSANQTTQDEPATDTPDQK